MRLSTIIISSAFVLAGMSAALPTERENMVARFGDSDFLAEVEARAYDEDHELYARGAGFSKPRGRKWDSSDGGPPQIRRTSSKDRLGSYPKSPTSSRDAAAYQSDKKSRAKIGNDRGGYRYDLP